MKGPNLTSAPGLGRLRAASASWRLLVSQVRRGGLPSGAVVTAAAQYGRHRLCPLLNKERLDAEGSTKSARLDSRLLASSNPDACTCRQHGSGAPGAAACDASCRPGMRLGHGKFRPGMLAWTNRSPPGPGQRRCRAPKPGAWPALARVEVSEH